MPISIESLILFLVLSVGLFFAGLVYFNDFKKKRNQLFLLSTIFLLMWVLFGYLITLPSQSAETVVLNTRVAYVGVFGWLVSTYFFLKYFPVREKEKSVVTDRIMIFSGVLLSFVTLFSDLLVEGAEIYQEYSHPVLGEGVPFIYFLILVMFLILLKNIYKKYSKTKGSERIKIQYFLVGLTLFLVANLVFNVFISPVYGMIPWAYIGNYTAILLLGFTAYAIVKKELFDIKVAVTSVFVVLIAILLGIDLLFLTKELWMQGVKGGIIIIFLIFGWQLIKSVIKEMEQREELQKAYKKLQRIDKMKTEFMSIVSHQLRTPLSIMKGHLSMLQEGMYEDEKKKEKIIKNVYESNERLINLVNDVLNISRIQSGRVKIDKEEADIRKVVKGVVKRMRSSAKEKGIKLTLHRNKEELPQVEIDTSKIENVLLNLLDNAIKYTEEGEIGVSIENQKDNIRIAIKDTGVGMTEEEIEKLFETFSRGSAGKKYWIQGSGLGLYIARQFVEMHGGKVWAESEGRGKGSTFYVRLPL